MELRDRILELIAEYQKINTYKVGGKGSKQTWTVPNNHISIPVSELLMIIK